MTCTYSSLSNERSLYSLGILSYHITVPLCRKIQIHRLYVRSAAVCCVFCHLIVFECCHTLSFCFLISPSYRCAHDLDKLKTIAEQFELWKNMQQSFSGIFKVEDNGAFHNVSAAIVAASMHAIFAFQLSKTHITHRHL